MNDAVPISPGDYTALVASNLKMRDKLLALAKECAACGGTGSVRVYHRVGRRYSPGETVTERIEPCGDCIDIREALR